MAQADMLRGRLPASIKSCISSLSSDKLSPEEGGPPIHTGRAPPRRVIGLF